MRSVCSLSSLLAALATAAVTVPVASCGGGGQGQVELPDAAYDCATETRADTFSVGMSKPGTQHQLTFRLMQSEPAPPSRNNNTWSIDVVDGNGAAVVGAKVTVVPFMPDHNHGTQIKAQVVEDTPGHYIATMVNLWMPGLWQVTINATPAGGTLDNAVFSFCIAG
jgi:hypothetical protein